MEMTGQHHVPAALLPGNPGKYCMRDWVNHRADLEVLWRTENVLTPLKIEP
jgi:hypothetical protein